MPATPLSISHLPPGSPWWMFAGAAVVLALHIGAGSIGILSGWGAVTVRKGETWHRRFGTVFTGAMLTMATMAISLAILCIFEGVRQQYSNLAAGVLAAYLVTTSWATVRRPEGETGLFEKIAFVAILATSLMFLSWGVRGSLAANNAFDGYRPVFYYVFAGIAALFAAFDLKVILQGGVRGTQRIARHLWRMCFAFFFASGSFFIGQQKVMPAAWHGSPILLALGVAPLAVMIFWLLRVRFKPWRTAQVQ